MKEMQSIQRGTWAALSLALGFGLLAVGCGSGLGEGQCVTNRDCDPDEQCISGSCRALDNPGGCTGDQDCLPSESCNSAGICETRQITDCQTDEDCPPAQRCNVAQGICEDGYRSCASQAQCQSAGLVCDFTIQQCRECVRDEHCDEGSLCIDSECVLESEVGCRSDAECAPPDTVCETGDCVAGCASPGSAISCGGGTACDSTTGRCGPGTGSCTVDTDCGPPEAICENQQCVPSCTQTGGLQCTGGFVCDTGTGRCESAGGCTVDTDCAPPASVCEGAQCVGGCGQIGGLQCATGSVCDTNTGRCVQLPGGCSLDSDCGPPSSICEGGQCIGGCAEAGGLQCTGNTVCNSGTGRCDPGTAVCQSDAECGPPGSICDLVSGQCVAGCTTTGCTGTDVCNTQTGRCGPPVPMNVALDGLCTANSECQSQHCFDLGSSVGARCVSSCRRSADCPLGFTCYNFNGANLCLAAQHFGATASFTAADGAQCSTGGECQSNFCPSQTTCTERCSNSSDCTGTTCSWREVSADNFIAACTGNVGAATQGALCSADTDCQSGVCIGGQCGDLCSTTSQCPVGTICALANYSFCPLEIAPGICFGNYVPFLVRACLPGTHGNGGVGTPCATFTPCRSGLCHTGLSQCTDTCGVDADCPSGWRCRGALFDELPDQTPIFINVCLPE